VGGFLSGAGETAVVSSSNVSACRLRNAETWDIHDKWKSGINTLLPALSALRTSPKSRHRGMAWSPQSAARRPTLPRPQAHVSVLKVKVTGAVLVGRVREKPEQGTGIGPPDRPPRVPGNFCEHESCSRCRLALGEPAQMEDAGGGIGRARRGRIRWKAEEPSILWKPQSNPK
jgi:hypothetical protein